MAMMKFASHGTQDMYPTLPPQVPRDGARQEYAQVVIVG